MESAAHCAAVERLVQRRRWPWFGRWIEVNGRPVHYVQQGEGPAVVLVHGFGGWSFSWRKNIAALAAAGYRVIAPDLLGYGFSDKSAPEACTLAAQTELLRHLLPALGAVPAVLVGNSMGGEVSLRLALHAPGLVRAVVLANSTGHVTVEIPERTLRWFRLPGAALLARALVLNRRFVTRVLHGAYGDRQRLSPDTAAGYTLPLHVPGAAGVFLGLVRHLDFGTEAGSYGRIQQPVLIIWGGADPWWPVEGAHRFQQQIPNARVIVYPGVGHIPMEELPERFNADLLSFLADLSPVADSGEGAAASGRTPARS